MRGHVRHFKKTTYTTVERCCDAVARYIPNELYANCIQHRFRELDLHLSSASTTQMCANKSPTEYISAILCAPEFSCSTILDDLEHHSGQLLSRRKKKDPRVRWKLCHFDIRVILSHRTKKTLKRAQGRQPGRDDSRERGRVKKRARKSQRWPLEKSMKHYVSK